MGALFLAVGVLHPVGEASPRGVQEIRAARQAMGERQDVRRHDVVVAALAVAGHAAIGPRRDGVVDPVLRVDALAERLGVGQEISSRGRIVGKVST